MRQYLIPVSSYAADQEIPQMPAGFLAHVPARNTGGLPSLEESGSLKAIATAWESQQDSWIALVAPDGLQGHYARIVLLSYGVGFKSVKLLKTTGCVPWEPGRALCVPKGTSPEVIDDLKGRGVTLRLVAASAIPQLPDPAPVKHAAVVLGNEPLDAVTPSLDLTRRALKGVECYASRPNTLLVLTGAATTGGLSEAGMMAVIASSRGVPRSGMLLEEKASTTHDNASESAKLLSGMELATVTVISKPSHLKTAMPFFRQETGFEEAQALACDVSEQEIMDYMSVYLEAHDEPRVRQRLELLRLGKHGVD